MTDKDRLLSLLTARPWGRKELLDQIRSWRTPEFFLRYAQTRAKRNRRARKTVRTKACTVAAGVRALLDNTLSKLRRRGKGVLVYEGGEYLWIPAADSLKPDGGGGMIKP